MSSQSPGSLTRDSFGTPPWESREKVPFGCNAENTIWGKVVDSPSPGRGESSESKVARGLSQHQKGAE
jgi:hypothetical protein